MYATNQSEKTKLFLLLGGLGLLIVILSVALFLLLRQPEEPLTEYGAEQTTSQADLMQYRNELRASDPAFSLLPYDSNPGHAYGFRVFALAPESAEQKITLSITIRTCEQPIRSNIQQAALDWLESNGLDLNNYLVKYDTTCD